MEITIDGKLCNFICLYRSPSQNMEEFETLVKNLELNFEFILNKNPYLTVAIGDLDAKSHNWYKGDKTTASRSKLDIMTSRHGLTATINEPTQILEDSSSCVDLVFTSQPNMVLDSGFHSSLHPNSHHQTVFAKFDLKVFYPPPYKRHVWHHKHSKNNRNCYHVYKYRALQGKLKNLIESSKQSYYKRVSQKLSSISASSKYYRSLLKRILNDKKIPVIPPLFHNNKFLSNFKEKSELFNELFSKQCSLIQNRTTIPSVFTPLTNQFHRFSSQLMTSKV